MWRPRTPVLELFPCSQNPAAVSLLAHWYGIAWLWSILFFFSLTLPLQQPSAGSEHLQWYPPSECIYPGDAGAKLDCLWSLTCVAAVLSYYWIAPCLRFCYLWAQNKNSTTTKKTQQKLRTESSQYYVTSSNPLGGQSLPCSLGPVLSSVSQLSNFWGPLLDGLLPGSRCEDRILGASTYGRLFKKHKGLQSRF